MIANLGRSARLLIRGHPGGCPRSAILPGLSPGHDRDRGPQRPILMPACLPVVGPGMIGRSGTYGSYRVEIPAPSRHSAAMADLRDRGAAPGAGGTRLLGESLYQ